MSDSIEDRVTELERKVEVLTAALVKASELSAGTMRTTQAPSVHIKGTQAIRETLEQGDLL